MKKCDIQIRELKKYVILFENVLETGYLHFRGLRLFIDYHKFHWKRSSRKLRFINFCRTLACLLRIVSDPLHKVV